MVIFACDFKLRRTVPPLTITSEYFRWQPIKGGNIVQNPGVQFPGGFHVQMIKKDQRKQEPEYTITN